jgi:lipopolysaccharide transport system permease protein
MSIITTIKPHKGTKPVNWKEIKQYKDLLYFLVLRDITVIYKQTILGFAWAIINPLISMVIFSVVFGKLAGIASDGIPYPLFSYCALIPWTYFAGAMNASSGSLISAASVFTKVYYPRIFIPLTPVISKMADFCISFCILIFFLIYYKAVPDWEIFALPLLIAIMMVTVSGVGFWLSALAIQYRDVRFAISFITPLLMYAAPVVFPSSLILTKFGHKVYLLYGFYPMAGVIEGFRGALLPQKHIPWSLVGMGSISAVIIFLTGWRFFRKTERFFADVA